MQNLQRICKEYAQYAKNMQKHAKNMQKTRPDIQCICKICTGDFADGASAAAAARPSRRRRRPGHVVDSESVGRPA